MMTEAALISENPASALHDALAEAKEARRQFQKPPTAMQVWSKAFKASDAELARKLAGIQRLSHEVRLKVQRLPDMDQEAIDEPMRLIEMGWLRNLDEAWDHYWTAVDGPGTLRLLRLAAGFINTAHPVSETLRIADVATLTTELRQIQDEVSGSDLDGPTKATVRRYLDELLASLEDAPATTSSLFRRTLEAMGGRLGLDPGLSRSLTNHAVGRKVLSIGVAASFAVPALLWVSSHLELDGADPVEPNQVIQNCFQAPAVKELLPGPSMPALPSTGSDGSAVDPEEDS